MKVRTEDTKRSQKKGSAQKIKNGQELL